MTSEDEWLRSGRVRAPPTEMTRELRDDSEAWHDSEPREGASALNANSWSGIGAIPKQGGGNHEDFQAAAKLLGISGEVLANYLSAPKHEGQKTDQFFPAVESQDQLKREIGEMLSDRDSDRQRDREFERIEREKDRRAQADMLRAIVDMNRPNRNPEVECFKVKFDAMEDKDDVDSYLEHYERIAALHRWPRHIMALRLLPLLKGQARDCVRDIPDEEITSYEVIKRALLFRFKRTPEYFRKKFRTSRREEGESFLQAVNKMVDQAKKWCTMTGCDRRDPEQVWNLFMQEACYQLLPPELETRVREREPSKYQDIAKIADTIFEARSATRMSRSLQPESKPVAVPVSDKRQDVEDATKFKKDGCHNCGSLAHFKKDCPRKNKVNISMVVTEPEVKPDLSLCDNDQEREFEPRGKAIVNGQEVSAIRDTGSEDVVVASRLVKEVDWTGREVGVRLADASVCSKFKTAIVHLESPYLDENVEAIVMDNPSIDVIIGNRAVLDSGRVVKIPVLPGPPEQRSRVPGIQKPGVPGIQKSGSPGVQKESRGVTTSKESSTKDSVVKKTRRGKKRKKDSPATGPRDLQLLSVSSEKLVSRSVNSIYGQATPVDTSKRQREIEEKMEKEDTVPKYSTNKRHRVQVRPALRATVCFDGAGESPTTSRDSLPKRRSQGQETRAVTRDRDSAGRSTSAPTADSVDADSRGRNSSMSASDRRSSSQGQHYKTRVPIIKDSAGGASCASTKDSTEAGVRKREVPHSVIAEDQRPESSGIEIIQNFKIERERSQEIMDPDIPIYVFSWIYNYGTGVWEHHDGYVVNNVYVSSEDCK